MSSLLREVLGDVLRQARITQGRTLRQVSDTARVSLGYLSEVERGRKEASSELLSAICDALDVPLSRLLTEASEQLARQELGAEPNNAGSPTAANIDASTKVVIPPVVAMALPSQCASRNSGRGVAICGGPDRLSLTTGDINTRRRR